MAMTLRLSEEAQAKLEAIAQSTGLSKNAAAELTITSFDERAEHRARFWDAINRIEARDAEALDLLSR